MRAHKKLASWAGCYFSCGFLQTHDDIAKFPVRKSRVSSPKLTSLRQGLRYLMPEAQKPQPKQILFLLFAAV